MTNSVQDWFGDAFASLAPELQLLHLQGGKLAGTVKVETGTGLAGVVGRRIAKKMNIPAGGFNHLTVSIAHYEDGLHWDRVFNHGNEMSSVFAPVGNIREGYWLEKTGPVEIKLTVEILDGAWRWKILGYRFMGLPLPKWLFPESSAYKCIEHGQYRFCVTFNLPLLGTCLAYSGLLEME